MRRFEKLVVLLCLVLLAYPFVAQAQSGKPKMLLNEVTYDAGTVFRTGEKIDHTFVIKNNGKANLEIMSVTPG